ncbi:MAG: hypothetical protein QXZ43_02710 [Candidatus Aenigmatarchaeota archaeon]
MAEENPSEPLNFFLIFFGLTIVFLFVLKPMIDAINIFVYFFSKANSQAISETISELITVSAGTPGNVTITFVKPLGYNYNVYFKDKLVFVEIFDSKKPIGISDKDLEKIGNRSYSSSAVSFESEDFLDFEIIKIQKNEKIKLNTIGDVGE